MQTGRIVRGVGGFYYVMGSEGKVYECRGRGILRRKGIKPLVGDEAVFSISDPEALTGSIEDITPRTNMLYRPEVANVDQAVVLFSFTNPEPSFNLLDRFLIELKRLSLSAVVCFNKCDLAENKDIEAIRAIYEKSCIPLIPLSVREGIGMEKLLEHLRGRVSVLAGPSGVGKSSLINRLSSEKVMETGSLSKKIQRGKNTTRHAELFRIEELSGGDVQTFVCDTPGFTSFELRDVDPEELRFFYPEFDEFEGECRFRGCSHTHEPGCMVTPAVNEGWIPEVRYQNYRVIYEQLKERRNAGT